MRSRVDAFRILAFWGLVKAVKAQNWKPGHWRNGIRKNLPGSTDKSRNGIGPGGSARANPILWFRARLGAYLRCNTGQPPCFSASNRRVASPSCSLPTPPIGLTEISHPSQACELCDDPARNRRLVPLTCLLISLEPLCHSVASRLLKWPTPQCWGLWADRLGVPMN
ncbi:hypothetical protein F5Y17DRAFT_372054 [Xylariaceae sp. FL0594]|nr:hypothetical protein F5Y17DRAFT_372054 [Xylariaceae sp. FL0594]